MKKTLLALLIAVSLCLSGCFVLPEGASDTEPAHLSMPADETPVAAPERDAVAPVTRTVTIYTLAQDQLTLTPQKRVVTCGAGETICEGAARALLESFPAVAGASLEEIAYSGGHALAQLTVPEGATEQNLFFLRAALTNTLCALDGVESVSILYNGRAGGLLSRPIGALGVCDTDLAALWAKYVVAGELADETGEYTRSVCVYYASRAGDRLVCEVRPVSLRDGAEPMYLAEAMRARPTSACARSAFPSAANALANDPTYVTDELGRTLVRFDFDASLLAMLENEGLKAWQLYASLACTVAGFLPDADGITVYVGSGQVVKVDLGGETRHFEDGVITSADFEDVCGQLAALYFSSGEKLVRVERVMARGDALSPRALLVALMAGPAEWDAGASASMPAGVGSADVLAVEIADGEARVNLSTNFYRCCQGLDAAGERNMIYAMVNTLSELDGVRSVRFFVAGERVETLVSDICVLGPLMPNPGYGT